MLAYLNIYDMKIPATSAVFIKGIRDVVTFQILKPDVFLDKIEPGLKLKDIINHAMNVYNDQELPATMESSGQTASFIVNMSMYIAAILMFFTVIAFLFLLMRFRKLRNTIDRILIGIKKKTFWNNTIRSITISYLETGI